ncbi:MAG: hypothetical protein COA63_014060 [Methylophaga sp.]|nr:hypothetical protein [Methylophaga sp.]
MKLSDLLERLALGELSNLALVNQDSPAEINVSDHLKVISYANQALTNLFTKFILSEKEILVNTYDPETMYYLRPEYARSSDSSQDVKYLDDSGDIKFTGGVIKILDVYGQYGQPLYINDIDEHSSLFTPQFDCLQITSIDFGTVFSVIYQAQHSKLSVDNLDIVIDIPVYFEEAIQAYIASKVLGHMNGKENTGKSQEYMNRYEMICANAAEKDTARTSIVSSNMKLIQRGFV